MRDIATGIVVGAVRESSVKHSVICLSLAAALACPLAEATTRLVGLTGLSSSTTAPGLFQGNESLLVNTLVTGSTGALTNPVFFNVGAGVTSLSGAAAWEIGTATGFDPCLVGVNIDIFDAANVLDASDTNQGTTRPTTSCSATRSTARPASPSRRSPARSIPAPTRWSRPAPRRDSCLDISLTLTGAQVTAVPEPESYALLLAGLGTVAVAARRRRGARR